jgi:selenium metabolism protein YedF
MNNNACLLVMVTSSGMGQGEPDLGEKLLESFFRMLQENGTGPKKMIFINSGIFLTTEGSPLIDTITEFENDGVEILSCGTCLDYYERADKLLVGAVTTMRDTVSAMLQADKIIQI